MTSVNVSLKDILNEESSHLTEEESSFNEH